MSRFGVVIAVILLVAGLVAGAWWYYGRTVRPVPALEPVPTEQQTDPQAATDEPPPRYPVPEPPVEEMPAADSEQAEPQAPPAPPEPLPPLRDSDGHILDALRDIFSAGVLDTWLKRERVIERLVVTINSLDGPAIPLRFWPVHNIEGLPRVKRDGDTLIWSATNVERYSPLIAILDSTKPEVVARVYFRNYPLFQQAYESLGLEETHFNDRLVEIVDHLLAAPELDPGFEVKQPKVLYEFADPELESESWGRKLLMRMGPGNAAEVKAWLRRLRAELVAGNPSGG